jgi:drug/metabolite transporter (DMT)-like permease
MKNLKVLSWTLLILLSLIWGSSFILIKRGLEVYGPGEVGALRILAACIFLLPVSLPKVSKLSKKHVKLLFGIGLLGTFIPAFLFAKGQTQLDSSITGVLNGLTPIFVLIIGALFYKQKATRDKLIGLAMAFIGTAILLLAGSGGDISKLNFYALFIVLATVCYGANLNIIKFHLSDLNPVVITSVSILFVGPLAAVYLFGFSDFMVTVNEHEKGLEALGYISLLGVMGTAIALILFNKLVQLTTPIFTSTVTYFIPIVAIVWGLLDDETLVLGQILGIVAIFTGVFVTNRKKK